MTFLNKKRDALPITQKEAEATFTRRVYRQGNYYVLREKDNSSHVKWYKLTEKQQ